MLGVREELLRGLIFLDPALIDEDDAVGHLAGEAHLVGDHPVSYTHLTLPTT